MRIKVNSVCGAVRDTWNLRHKFNSQGPALRILDLRVGHNFTDVRVPESWVSGSRVSGSQVSGSWGLRSQDPRSRASSPGSQVLILDYA